MAVGGLDRRRLAQAVKRERTRRGLSVRAAAREAGVDRATWAGVEDESRLPQDAKAALMEPVIGMGPGSFDALLSGGEPTPVIEREAEPVDPEDRIWEALRVKYEAWRAEKGP